MDNKQVLSSLALDLKRIALAYHRGSPTVGNRFVKETKRWRSAVDMSTIPAYLNKILVDMDALFLEEDKIHVAENSLMYSTLIRNYSVS